MKIAGVVAVLTCSAIACGELATTQGPTDDGGDQGDSASQESGTDSDDGATSGFTTGIASDTVTGFTTGVTDGIANGTSGDFMTGVTTVLITTGAETGITTLGTGPTSGPTTGIATGTTTFTTGTATGTTITITTGTATGTTTFTTGTGTNSGTGMSTGVSNGTTTLTCSGNACCGKSSVPAALGDAELTCYTFAQGPQSNTTFCGYRESETAYSDSDAGGGACVTGGLAYNDTVPNVGPSPGYFVAFPSNDIGWGQGTYCGMCMDVTYAGRTLMATVVDQCATCGNSPGHIALSANLARDLGVGVGSVSGDVLGATWTAVACPITSNNGNIVVAWDSNGRASFQNVTFPVATVAGTMQTGGAWIVDAGASVTLTDLVGHQIMAVMPTTDGGSLGTQFPASCP